MRHVLIQYPNVAIPKFTTNTENLYVKRSEEIQFGEYLYKEKKYIRKRLKKQNSFKLF